MLTVFLDIKKNITINFLEKGCNCIQCYLLSTPRAKFTLFIKGTSYICKQPHTNTNSTPTHTLYTYIYLHILIDIYFSVFLTTV